MSNIEIGVLRKDECQPLTQAQMENIKSQFHPSNTANVNIVPYEIYDEDEHIVGEWRQTIDGVKKKKPVYEKYYSIIAPTASATAVVVATYNTSFNIIKMSGMIGSYPLSCYQGANYYLATFANEGNIYIEQKNIASGLAGKITLNYTKTTDEWEEV